MGSDESERTEWDSVAERVASSERGLRVFLRKRWSGGGGDHGEGEPVCSARVAPPACFAHTKFSNTHTDIPLQQALTQMLFIKCIFMSNLSSLSLVFSS